MTNVILVNTNTTQPLVGPLGLDYLARALEVRGLKAEILDLALAQDPKKAIREKFKKTQPAAVGITVRNTDDCCYPSRDFFLPGIKNIIRKIRQSTDAPLVLGGVGFSVMPAAVLEFLNADFGIWGEGEETFPCLVLEMIHGKKFWKVPGLVWKKNNEFIMNPARAFDLANTAVQPRNFIDNMSYFMRGGMAGIESKRGCDRRCIYCADPLAKGRKIRRRKPGSVADEFKTLLSMGITHFHICDSEFNRPYEHAMAVCRELIKRRLGEKIRWYAYLSPKPFDKKLANAMKKAGCAGINFGADSADDAILRRLGRDHASADLRKTAEICHACRIVFMYDLLLGGPGETKASIRKTIETMKRINPSRIGASYGVRIYPGTIMAKIARREGVVSEENNFLRPVFYLSKAVGNEPGRLVASIVRNDERFLFTATAASAVDIYNYNENTTLVEAIRNGARGAFWDILRRAKTNE